MSARIGRVALALASFLALGSCGRDAGLESPRPPNVLLIVVDDLGRSQVGAYAPSRPSPTPQIDRIAAGGVRFDAGYVMDPLCGPSRLALLTGRYPQRSPDRHHIPPGQPTLGDVLRDAGYETGFVGKWNQGVAAEHHPERRGFDAFFGFLGGVHDYYRAELGLAELRERIAATQDPGERPRLVRRGPLLEGEREVERFLYLTDEFTERAIAFVERSRERPFLLVLAYNAIHGPLQAPPGADEDALRAGGAEAIVAAMRAGLDAGVGRVLDAVDRTEGETIVVFLSDNGSAPPSEPLRTAGALRGRKGALTEGGIRVPFLLRWPGVVAPGTIERRPVTAMDLLPTLAGAAGVAGVAGSMPPSDGVDLRPYLRGVEAADPHAALHWGTGRPGRLAVRVGRYKLVEDEHAGVRGLFDLEVDPGEQRDLGADAPEVVARLRAAHAAWRGQLGLDAASGAGG